MAEDAAIESSIRISGIVAKDERAPTGFELKASSFKHFNISRALPHNRVPEPGAAHLTTGTSGSGAGR